jgi:hypothetical protein
VSTDSSIKLDRVVRAMLSTEVFALDWNLDVETLKVNDDGKYGRCSDEIHHIRETFAPETIEEMLTNCASGKCAARNSQKPLILTKGLSVAL